MRKISAINRSKNEARQYYDRISKIYDWLTSGEKAFIQKSVAFLDISPEEKIADIGCGTGTGLVFIQKELSNECKSIGIDLSHQMLLESQRKINSNESGHYLVQGDGAKLPIRSNQLDGLLCSFTLELFSKKEIPIVLDEFHRILKKDGRLAIVSLAQEPHTMAVEIYELTHKLFPIAVDCRPIPLLDLLVDHGFKIKESERHQFWGIPIKIALCQPKK